LGLGIVGSFPKEVRGTKLGGNQEKSPCKKKSWPLGVDSKKVFAGRNGYTERFPAKKNFSCAIHVRERSGPETLSWEGGGPKGRRDFQSFRGAGKRAAVMENWREKFSLWD